MTVPGHTTPAGDVLARLSAGGATVAVAESLTGGAVLDALVAVPNASVSLVGGVVAYATVMKHDVLGVDAALLAARGPVDPDVALAMADGVRRLTGAALGVGTTGVAGPGPQDGRPAGEFHVAVTGTWRGAAVRVVRSTSGGDGRNRAAVRAEARDAALDLLLDVLRGTDPSRTALDRT